MKVLIQSPEKTLFSGEAKLVEVPGSKGRFQMLNHHASIVSTLVKGKLVVTTALDEQKTFEISGGIIEHKQNTTVILVET